MDKKFQIAAKVKGHIMTEKKPESGIMEREDEQFCKILSSDTILVENYFG